MTTRNKNIPELRFKEFEGKWDLKLLGDIAEVKRGAPSQHLKYVTDPSKGVRLLRINDFLKDDAVYVEDTDDIKRFRVKTNDLLIAGTGATAGITFIVPEKFNNLSFSYNAPRVRVEKAHYGFIYLYLTSEIVLKQQARLFVGNAQHFLDTDVMRGFKIMIPSLPEQQKIASFLSAIDEKIRQLTRRKELLEQYKKGVMQQLFSGMLRFKPAPHEVAGDEKGKAYPKWEEKRLGDVADIKRGAASQHLKYTTNGKNAIRLLRINDFLSDEAVFIEDTEDIKRFRVKTNDLLIAGTGATAGIIFIVPEKFNELAFSYNAPRIRITTAFHTFIYYYLKSDIILKQQQRLFVGNAQPFLDTDSMRGFKINLPSILEQQKIASFLSSIDTKIESVTAQIERTQRYKKGLLQKMFV